MTETETVNAEDPIEGVGPSRLRSAAKAVTIVHAVASAVSVAFDGSVRAVMGIGFVVALGIGMVAFVAAFFTAVNRSRREQVTVVGAFFLSDEAVPKADRRLFLGAVAIQTVVAFAAASIRPFTAVAFTVLVPLLGLAIAAQFGSRFGRFDPQKM